MDYTPNYKLSLPAANSTGWTDSVNGNMRTIDFALSQNFTNVTFVGDWHNNTVYAVGNSVYDPTVGLFYVARVAHTSAVLPTTFATDRINNPTYWGNISFGPTSLSVLTALIASLPTVLPGAPGVLWNNGGVVCMS